MNENFIPEIDFYKIKVNKKDSYKNIHKNKNGIMSSYIDYLNLGKSAQITSNSSRKEILKSKSNSQNISIYPTPIVNINKKIIKCKNNSNSEEKTHKGKLHINCFDEGGQKEGNILDDLINNKYLKPILESQDIDEKLLNCNLKEPVKNNFNVSLYDFFNRRKKYYLNFKTPKVDTEKVRDLSIGINNYDISNQYTNDNDFNGTGIHNKTMENNNININGGFNNNNINNYYNDIQMTNNYYNNYNNNEINILNPPLLKSNIKIRNLCSSSVGKKFKNYFTNNNITKKKLLYCPNSNERNKNLSSNYDNFTSTQYQYINDKSDYLNLNDLNSPDSHYFKSQTYTLREKNKNIIKGRNKYNKEINIRNDNIYEQTTESKNEDINKKYDHIKNIIKHNNKYDYNKKLFDIYRGKLINEFFRHLQKAINNYFIRLFRYFIEQMKYLDNNNSKKIDEIFIPKIYLGKPNLQIESNNNSNKISSNEITIDSINKKNPLSQIFNSEKKYNQKPNIGKYIYNNLKGKEKYAEYKKYQNNINNSAIINEQNILVKTNRNSLISSINKNNIKTIKMNTNNNNNLIYKKKVKLSKKNFYKKNNKNNILSNSRGKIIDIDINLGKPLRDISDISPLESGLFINNYNFKIKQIKGSLSTNKREKKIMKKSKSKSKKKKFSLPRKKYLEENYDSYSLKNFDEDINNNNSSFDNNLNNDNFSIKANNKNIIQPLIYKSSKTTINKRTEETDNNKKILINNIISSDKRLFINVNYIPNIPNLSFNKNKNEIYNNNILIIQRNIYFQIFGINSYKNRVSYNKSVIISTNIGRNRNNNKLIENENKKLNQTNYFADKKNKYLNSCIKFIIKSINRVFLEKAFKYFLNQYKIYKNKKNINENKDRFIYNRMNTYKKKIGKNKI